MVVRLTTQSVCRALAKGPDDPRRPSTGLHLCGCITAYSDSSPIPATAIYVIEGRWQCLQPAQHPQAQGAPRVPGPLRMQRRPLQLVPPCSPPRRLAQQQLPPLQPQVHSLVSPYEAQRCLQGTEALRSPQADPGAARAAQAGRPVQQGPAPGPGGRQLGRRLSTQPALHRTAAG